MPSEHGTNARYHYHRSKGEEPCDPCKAAHAEYSRNPTPRQLAPCGTPAAYYRHLYHGEEPCEPCKTARSEYQRAKQKPKTEAQKVGHRAHSRRRHAAVRELIGNHYPEFLTILTRLKEADDE